MSKQVENWFCVEKFAENFRGYFFESFGGKCSGKNLTGKSLAGLEHHTVEINGDVTMETTNEYRTTHLIDTGS